MRFGAVAALCALCAPAAADPLEASGFLGAERFGRDIALGGASEPDQRPQSAPLLGGRLLYLVAPHLGGGRIHLELGLEAELAVATAWTGYGLDQPRMSYFAPIFDWRGGVLLRLAGARVRPHLELAAGGATIVSDSPFMRKETDPQLVWGVGASYAPSPRWQLRLDLRQGVMPAEGSGASVTYELAIGFSTAFGLARRAVAPPRELAPPPPPVDRDRDGDGIPDRLDRCPDQPETVNGIEDDDGCPEADPDGDGIVGAADKCPDEPEDKDGFQDEDGCPDPDNDGDGIPDAADKCPDQPETYNGFEDEDGCPDDRPKAFDDALRAAGAVRFVPGSPRLSDPAKRALDPLLGVLRDHPRLRVTIAVAPDARGAELARKRAEAIRWYLVEQGVAEDQAAPVVGDAKGPAVTIQPIVVLPPSKQ
ncbi:MAG TPA: OmpA family protein [Kofleriaceae bacterium]|nr:OmpA family protein [Kofleriaceae bacterium]